MAIDQVNLSGNSGIENQRNVEGTQGKEGRGGRTAETGRTAEDALQISPLAIEIARLANQVEQTSDLGADRTERIRQAIEAGTYNVSGEDIARKLIEALQK